MYVLLPFCCNQQVLALADHDTQRKEIAFADIYHSATRFNTGPGAHIPICLPSSVMYSFERQRIVLGILELK